MGSKGDVVIEPAGAASLDAEAHVYNLLVVHAADDADFVRGYLLPALDLPSSRVLLIDALPLGGIVVAEIEPYLAAASRSPCCLPRTSRTAGRCSASSSRVT